MSVALIGNFMYQQPDEDAVGSFDLLLAYFLIERYVTANFTLYAMCEARPTHSPGILLYNRLNDICNSTESFYSHRHICQHLVTESLYSLFIIIIISFISGPCTDKTHKNIQQNTQKKHTNHANTGI